MKKHIFTGFGFGPIQGGLFAKEAYDSGNFQRIVIAEIDQNLVDAVRDNNGTYFVNVAKADGIEVVKIENIEIFNPNVDRDRQDLLDALAMSTEIVTSLPSVSFFDSGPNSVAKLIAAGLAASKAPAAVIYATENNNHAAEILSQDVEKNLPSAGMGINAQYLNTVIGKMSQVVTDCDEIKQKNLKTIAPGIDRAFLVEEFNKILVTKCCLDDFKPGIEVFLEKTDLLPFEEAKLYGHNAIHALLAYLGMAKGYEKMTDLRDDAELMAIARDAFLNESGAALIKKYADLGDELFTQQGYKQHAEDLLERITNPYLSDTTERAGRDVTRKLGYNDRIFGTMVIALQQQIEPVNMALGAAAGISELLKKPDENKLPDELRFDPRNLNKEKIQKILHWLWQSDSNPFTSKLAELTCAAI